MNEWSNNPNIGMHFYISIVINCFIKFLPSSQIFTTTLTKKLISSKFRTKENLLVRNFEPKEKLIN